MTHLYYIWQLVGKTCYTMITVTVQVVPAPAGARRPPAHATAAGERSPKRLQEDYQDVRSGLVNSPFRLPPPVDGGARGGKRAPSKRGSGLSVQAGECSSA